MPPRLGAAAVGAVGELAPQAAVVAALALQAPVAAPPGRVRRSTTAGLMPVPTMSAALASITSTSTATSTSMSKVMAVAVAVGTMTTIRSRRQRRLRRRRRDFRRRRLAGAKRAAKLRAGELRWHGLSTMRQHLVSAPGIAVRRGQSAVLIANELLVRVARTTTLMPACVVAASTNSEANELGEPGAAGIHAAP